MILASEKQGFPDDRDRQLQQQAERTYQMADDLVEWAGKHVEKRRESDFAIKPDEEFSLYRLRRLASNLWRSANVPVAAAVYGASQVGKSLFVGRVLESAESGFSPLGKCDQLGPPGYFPELSFQVDINPGLGSNEATALVTRFTTKERFDEKALPEYPVKICALTRAEWLRVLARGFRSECIQPTNITWREGPLRELFEEVAKAHLAESVDRDWRMDLLDVYAYLRSIDPRLYEVSESMFNSFLSEFPLTDAGYVELAGRMFWDREHYPALTALFNDVCRFIEKVTSQGRDGILVHWAAVRFLLDSQRKLVQQADDSRWKKQVAWRDLSTTFRDGWYVIDYQPGGRGPDEELAIIQSAMLEMIVPVIPHRLKEDWREVILKMDLLDLPGMRAGNSDNQGGAAAISETEQKMNVVKRGKVFYLIDRYIEERQVQTLLFLVRGGNLEVRQLLKGYIDKWGRTRYGEKAWPTGVVAPQPALFIGMTGIDQEFKDRSVAAELYDARLNQLVNGTLYEVMTDFGGPGQPFTNIYPIRYPGTWDADEKARNASSPEKWQQAGKYFADSPLVRKYVRNPREKWEVAMRDNDGGLSLISKGFVDCTTYVQKQDSLQEQINKVHQSLRALAEGWYCNPDANKDREARIGMARKVLAWLEDEDRVYDRVRALQDSMCFEEGDAMELANFSDDRSARSRTVPKSVEQRFPAFLRGFLGNWARELATQRWHEHVARHEGGKPWLPLEDFGTFTRFLCDYLCCGDVFAGLSDRLLSVMTLPIRDEGDRRHAQREYVRVILNDYVLNPGPSDAPLEPPAAGGDRDYGLMESFLTRWKTRLPLALASAAGALVQIPAGNDELQRLLNTF